jgi:hypothetical protein
MKLIFLSVFCLICGETFAVVGPGPSPGTYTIDHSGCVENS